MPQEFVVKFERDLPEDTKTEVEEAVRSAVFAKIANLDLSRNVTVSSDLSALRELLGGHHTAGMLIR